MGRTRALLLLLGVALGGTAAAWFATSKSTARAAALPPAPPPLHPATPSGIELGRKLFFDPRLSGNDRIACASCHDPARAFSDGVALSTHGASGKPLARNSPSLANIAWLPELFLDGGAKNLESMTFAPIIHADEMGEDPERLLAQLREDPALRRAFWRAFPADGLTAGNVMRALAQYMRSLVSNTSRYDRGELSAAERRGQAVHAAKCARCHAGPLFTDLGYHDIGLDPAAPLAHDDHHRGRARITFRAEDERAYRTPSLRNLSYTAPYMHDGRFATLDEVIDHYRFSALRGQAIPLTDAEARDLRAFLGALDDHAFVTRHVTARMGLRSSGR